MTCRQQINQADRRRNAELGVIHLGAKTLGMEREDYEAMLWTLARVHSAADLDEHGRRAVIEHLRSRGFKPRVPRPAPTVDKARLVAKVQAMLTEAARTDEYADGMARKMFHVEKWGWLSPEQLRRLVAALVYDARRHGRPTQ